MAIDFIFRINLRIPPIIGTVLSYFSSSCFFCKLDCLPWRCQQFLGETVNGRPDWPPQMIPKPIASAKSGWFDCSTKKIEPDYLWCSLHVQHLFNYSTSLSWKNKSSTSGSTPTCSIWNLLHLQATSQGILQPILPRCSGVAEAEQKLSSNFHL